MRLLIFILLLSVQSFGQNFVFPAVYEPPGPPPTIPGVRTLIYDEFTGSTLNSRWFVRRPDRQTLSVSGGFLNVSTFTDTVPQRPGYNFSNLTAQTMIYDTSYNVTSLRNYTDEVGFQITSLGDTSIGNFLGVYSPFPVTWSFTNFSHIQFSSPDTLRLLADKDTSFSVPPAFDDDITGQIDFNTSDYYVLRHSVFEGYTITTIVNRTQGDSIIRYFPFDFVHGSYPARPNYFYFAFGSMGRTRVKYDYFLATTIEELNPVWLVVGDSKSAGYNANLADSAFGNMLKRNTNDSVQIFAGGGLGVDEVLLLLPKIKEINPDYIIFDVGTNNTFNSTYYGRYARIIDSFSTWGITSYKLLQPNGLNPVGGGSWNQWIKDTYGSTYIDDWTTGWNTWTIGNGRMYDGVHNTLLGTQDRYAIIKAALIAFFPL